MVIDPSKLQENNRFAKKLVEQRLAANMEDAMNKISSHEEVKEEELKITPHDDAGNKEVGKVADSNEKVVELEKKLNRIAEFFNQFKDVVNKNFREVDMRLNELKSKTRVEPVRQKEQPVQQGAAQPQPRPQKKEMAQKADPDNFGEDEFAIEKYFSNSGGKMAKK
ncbi:hypothetical protein KY311_01355 [Candidatus Woesearchaeota archaeon]|nr:hypothetical protein [Candidatus Woesearchaeota archaeon]